VKELGGYLDQEKPDIPALFYGVIAAAERRFRSLFDQNWRLDISQKFFDIFSKKRLAAEAIFATAIRSAAMLMFAAMHSQSGRLPTIVTQRPHIEGMATFGVRVATLATTASWDRGKSITGGSIYLVLVFIYFRCRDLFALFETVPRRCS
jgi:hypothetical protein